MFKQELPLMFPDDGEVALVRDRFFDPAQAVDAHQPDVAVVDVRLPPTFSDEGLPQRSCCTTANHKEKCNVEETAAAACRCAPISSLRTLARLEIQP